MKAFKRAWLHFPIAKKTRSFTMLVIIVIALAVIFNLIINSLSLTSLGGMVRAASACTIAQEAMGEEVLASLTPDQVPKQAPDGRQVNHWLSLTDNSILDPCAQPVTGHTFCLALFFPLTAAAYWLTDIKDHTAWTAPIAPAGTATLTCYLLPYVWYPVCGVLGLHLPQGVYYGVTGILLSLAFSLIVIQVARGMKRIGLVVRL